MNNLLISQEPVLQFIVVLSFLLVSLLLCIKAAIKLNDIWESNEHTQPRVQAEAQIDPDSRGVPLRPRSTTAAGISLPLLQRAKSQGSDLQRASHFQMEHFSSLGCLDPIKLSGSEKGCMEENTSAAIIRCYFKKKLPRRSSYQQRGREAKFRFNDIFFQYQ